MSCTKNLQSWLDWLYPLRFLATLIIIGFIHFVLWLHVEVPNRPLVHKFIAFIGQVGGAAIIFYTINGTLNSFKGVSLGGMFLEWWRKAPWHPGRIFNIELSESVTIGASMHTLFTPSFTTLEQRVDFIHNKLNELDAKLFEQGQDMDRKVKKVKDELNKKIINTCTSLEVKITQTVEEELLHQLCGFMMLIYGVVTSLAL
ncbi:hypothetical protein DND132_1860 [Pseudodesulfovibrio mercurii]|uniref:Uncharacterized protein n=1 Tax=Pseudodesulfovibrio mercurii TaxID=641491 RepID=F0JGE9_9BACT|nr:hypothetical protein [Pseudodesulfovibrio mercurii]EGB15066.1 hypothetical protein DND132_1860 [Pseudodesulfovibrio mercurii]